VAGAKLGIATPIQHPVELVLIDPVRSFDLAVQPGLGGLADDA
jgi:hypothetical protein